MSIPVFATDLFSTAAIDRPYPLYKAIRDRGSVSGCRAARSGLSHDIMPDTLAALRPRLEAEASRQMRKLLASADFDVHRDPKDHVGWGHGAHSCAGRHLARLEMEVMLEALVDQVDVIAIKHSKRLRHNVLQGFVHLDVSFSAKSS